MACRELIEPLEPLLVNLIVSGRLGNGLALLASRSASRQLGLDVFLRLADPLLELLLLADRKRSLVRCRVGWLFDVFGDAA
jgi:hypothetical protein